MFCQKSVGEVMEQMISLGQIDSSDTLGTTFHNAALGGNKKAVKKVLDKGIHVDYPNDEGQTPLFCASLNGHYSVVEYLLSVGADANEKSNSGLTPVHAACYTGHARVLMKLLQEGGDLRLHDHQGRSVKDWAMLNPVPKKRMKLLEFLDKTRMFAMSNSGHDLLMKKASSRTLSRAHQRRNSVTKIIRDRIGRPSVNDNLQKMATSHHCVGFGHVYVNGSEDAGFVSAIPLVSENNLRHDNDGEAYNNGTFTVMESMWWDYTKVTVKKLNKDVDPYQGGVVDLLINEIEHIGKLRHPNILTLMGVCQTSNLDAMILVYERIPDGSLYNFMHQKMERLPSQMIQDVAVQMCDAVIFLHLRGVVHCAITSHAINVIGTNIFKLANFEYMIEASKCDWGKKNAVANNHGENSVYNWMAPEVMMHMPPSFFCDMFSYCAVLWEMFHGEVPWDGECAESIKARYSKGSGLTVYNGKMPEYFKVILEYGLYQDPTGRQLSFLHVRDLLLTAPKDAQGYIKSHLRHLHSNEPQGGSHAPSAPPRDTTNHPTHTSRTVDQALRDMAGNQEKERGGQYRQETGKDSGQYRQETRKHRQHERKSYGDREKESERGTFENSQWNEREDRERQRQSRQSSGRYGPANPRQVSQYTDHNNNNCNSSPAITCWNDTRQPIELHNSPKRKPLQLHYDEDGLSWESLPQEDGDEYTYTVRVKKSPQKSTDSKLLKGANDVEAAQQNRAHVSSGSSSQPSETTSTESTERSGNRELGRKTSSMGRFSYLQLAELHGPKTTAAKPACHGHTDYVADEYSTAGKLTSAGSLYALYNEHSPDRPLGQRTSRTEYTRYSTLPSRRKQSPMVESDPSWFGGRGSVRDLASVFQNQIQDHNYYQDVVNGTVNKNHSNEKMFQAEICTPTKDNKDYYHMVFDSEEEDSCSTFTCGSQLEKCESDATVDSSTESDIVSKWVDHELRKIKRNLSREEVMKKPRIQAQSPDLFEISEQLHASPPRPPSIPASQGFSPVGQGYTQGQESMDGSSLVTPDTSDTSLGSLIGLGKGDHVKEHIGHFYDDEIYSAQNNSSRAPVPTYHTQTRDHISVPHHSQTTRSLPWVPDQASNESSTDSLTEEIPSKLPMKTILKKTRSSSSEILKDSSPSKGSRNSKRGSRIPTSSWANLHSDNKAGEGAYANIVTVRSRLDDAGVHQVTHTVKDLGNGGARTLMKDIVNARKVVTKFQANN